MGIQKQVPSAKTADEAEVSRVITYNSGRATVANEEMTAKL